MFPTLSLPRRRLRYREAEQLGRIGAMWVLASERVYDQTVGIWLVLVAFIVAGVLFRMAFINRRHFQDAAGRLSWRKALLIFLSSGWKTWLALFVLATFAIGFLFRGSDF